MRAFLKDDIKRDRRARAAFELLALRSVEGRDRAKFDELMEALVDTGVSLPSAPAWIAAAVNNLAAQRTVVFRPEGGTFTLYPSTAKFSLTRTLMSRDERFKISKFSYLSFENGTLTIRNPLSDCHVELHDPALAGVFGQFHKPLSIADAHVAGDAFELVTAMADSGMLLPCDAEGESADDREPPRRMWEFHDLLFHSRSRLGRTDGDMGGVYGFKGDIPEPPAVAEMRPDMAWIPLPTPAAGPSDIDVFDAIARRRSVRSFAERPVSLAQLGAFLHHSIRPAVDRRDDKVTLRPRYPSGGALNEQSFYVLVDRMSGLERGLYVYDGVEHRLGRLSGPDGAANALLDDAARAMGVAERPPILVVIASRFGRVQWKYRGMAYALELKHVGVIQEAMYLVATALGLGGCALGLGNTDAFCALAGLDYLEEGSIGEFVLGVPEPSDQRDS